MNIAVIHQYYLHRDDAGISRFNQFAKYWTAAGHNVTIICGTVHYMTGIQSQAYAGKYIVETQENGITVIRCHVSEEYNKHFFGRMKGYFSFMLSSLVAVMRMPRHDVVIATSPPLFVGIPGVIASWKWRSPFVFEVRDLWPDSAIELGVLTNRLLVLLSYAVEKFLYRSAAKINTLGPGYRDALIKKKHITPDRISMISNGADADILIPTKGRDAVREEFGWTNTTVVTYIGAHGIANHLEQILDTAELMRESHTHIRFVLMGSGMRRQALMDSARTRGLANVQFIDPQPKNEVANFIYASDICLAVLKKADVFKTVYPNKIFDYMVCKKPIIVAIDGAARELVETARAGVFVEPENPKQLMDAVIALADNQDERDRLGENGSLYVQEHFSRETLAKAYLDILQSLIVT